MTHGISVFRSAAAIALAAITLTACDREAGGAAPKAAGDAAPTTGATTTPAATAPNRSDRLLAAAEGYETLTETAFDRPFADLAATLASARQRASEAQALLPPDQASRFAALNGEIDLAMGSQDRTAIAIASVETYRVLVSAQDSSAPAPVEVSLLDYAGFKYDAIARSRPIDWGAMAADVTYARETWARLTPRVAAPGLKGAFDSALAGMDAAVQQKNEGAARIAASNELALVDALEEHFAAQNRPAAPAPPSR